MTSPPPSDASPDMPGGVPAGTTADADVVPVAASTVDRCRIDKFLWAVRVFKTRTAATTACTSGRVPVNDEPAKPATKIVVGDLIEARRGDQLIVYRARALVEKRVGAKLVPGYVEDLSPPKPKRSDPVLAPPGGARNRGDGRPTKKERREIDRLRGRR
ncbi:MAG: S4 domain-containing protein [Actinomycetota bacterium]